MTASTTPLPSAATGFVCPFCGLLCDDLPGPAANQDLAGWSHALQAACPRSAAGIAGLADASHDARIDGKPVSVEIAIAEAGRRLGAARRPVVGGLGGDVQAMRAVLDLADRAGARLLHRNQFAAQRNLFAQQSRGAMTATLAEVKNRAELVVVVGSDVTRNFPRILERLFAPDPVFTEAGRRRLILLGAPKPARLPDTVAVESVDAGGLDLFDAIAVLRAAVDGRPLPAHAPAALGERARRLRECRYGAVLWAAADLDFGHADLLVEQMHQLVMALNRTTRWAALPLGGNDGDLTANAVTAWQTGFPLPVAFAAGEVAYDPFPDYADADLVLWLGALPGVGAPRVPGLDERTPAIVVGAPKLAHDLPPQHVFIPVATPGVSAAGHLIRTDNVITLYAPAVRPSPLPAAAAVVGAIAGARP